jgi:endonuclease YncB( thermonuclease family)
MVFVYGREPSGRNNIGNRGKSDPSSGRPLSSGVDSSSRLVQPDSFSQRDKSQSESVAIVETGRFKICTSDRWHCVVDGDTFILNGIRVRIADIDAPEIGGARCEYEYRLGLRAKFRLAELLNEGPIRLQPIDRDVDRYGRKLRVVSRNGQSLGDELVKEGLARRWDGGKKPWC